MFRINKKDNFLIDATMTGSPARYVNHSCNPNCIVQEVCIKKNRKIFRKIFIVANKTISIDEEVSN